MRVAILSDVHGNRFALEAVLADIASVTPDVICNLGDTVWGGADPAEAWALQVREAPPTVRGNTDEFLLADAAELRPETRAYREFIERELGGVPSELASLPVTATVAGGEVLLAHGAPSSPWDALFLVEEEGAVRPALPAEMLERVAGWPTAQVVVVGHTHQEQVATHHGVTLINAGAVSRQGHGDPAARWVLLERRAGWWNVAFRRTSYDVEAAARCAEAHAPNGAGEARQLRTGLKG